jgi:hypothetical protein
MDLRTPTRSIFILSALLTAACAHQPAEDADYSACSLHTACYVQDVPGASLSAIRSNGDSLEVRCPDTDRIDAAYRARCQASLEAAIASLSRWPGELSPPAATELRLKEEEACIDTSVPDRDSADCGHYAITATLPLRWLPEDKTSARRAGPDSQRLVPDRSRWNEDFSRLSPPDDGCPGGTLSALRTRLSVEGPHDRRALGTYLPGLGVAQLGPVDEIHSFRFSTRPDGANFWGFSGSLISSGNCIIHVGKLAYDN